MIKENYLGPGKLLGTASEMATPKYHGNEIGEQLSELGEALTQLHNYLSQLESRLDPVLRPIPVGGDQSPQCRESMCPVANEIHGHRCGVDSASTRIVHILDRLGI